MIYSVCKKFVEQTEPIFTENDSQIFCLFPDITAPSSIFYSLEQNLDKETNASEALKDIITFSQYEVF